LQKAANELIGGFNLIMSDIFDKPV
jgi:hypothetical protein